MAPTLAPSRITELRTVLDAEPVITTAGAIIWAKVDISYSCGAANPSVTIRVPLSWSKSDTDTERRDMALRFARQLIDHACAAMVPPIDVQTPVFEGLAQELGLSDPTTKPPRKRTR